VFRNVINRARGRHATANPEDENWERGVGFKAYGVNSGWGGGRSYFFNNTHLQQPGDTYSPPQPSHLGVAGGLIGSSNGQGLKQVCSRNNVYHHFRTWGSSIVLGNAAANNDLNYDLFSEAVQTDGATPDDICSAGANSTFEAQGILNVPDYKTGHGWDAFPRLSAEPSGPATPVFGAGLGVGVGQFHLESTSPGANAGQALPNFTADIDNTALAEKSGVAAGGTPDMGAHDSASGTTMKFGIPAAQ
jgi:hypothetical protein